MASSKAKSDPDSVREPRKDKDLKAHFNELAKKTGGEVLGKMKSAKYFVDTGSLALNFCCSGRFIHGGIPGSRYTEIYGPSSSGKTLFAQNCLAGVQRLGGIGILLDCENAANPEWMSKASHIDVDTIVRYTPQTLEEAFLKIHNVLRLLRDEMKRTEPILFVYDSISASPCKRELLETNLPDDYTEADHKKIVKRNEQPGERAKVCSKEFRKLTPKLEQYDATVIFINQIRANVGVLYGSPEVTGGGGNALPFYASLRFRTQQKKKIENKRLGTYAGVNTQIKNIKNRSFAPFRVADGVKLLFESGINPISGLLSCLVQAERVEMKSGGNYLVLPEFLGAGKEKCGFKASKEENEVPLDVLLENPKLIDAETGDEVLDYLMPFGDFQGIFNSADLVQTELGADEQVDESILEKYDNAGQSDPDATNEE